MMKTPPAYVPPVIVPAWPGTYGLRIDRANRLIRRVPVLAFELEWTSRPTAFPAAIPIPLQDGDNVVRPDPPANVIDFPDRKPSAASLGGYAVKAAVAHSADGDCQGYQYPDDSVTDADGTRHADLADWLRHRLPELPADEEWGVC